MIDTEKLIKEKESTLCSKTETWKVLLSRYNQLCQENQVELTPEQLLKIHIKRLKEYNELRDTGLRLAQLIADEKSVKIKDIFEEMGYSMNDD